MTDNNFFTWVREKYNHLKSSFKNIGKRRMSVRISKTDCFEYALHT